MMVKYEECKYEEGQKCFGAGLWVLKRTSVEAIASFPSRDALHRHLKDCGIELNKEIMK